MGASLQARQLRSVWEKHNVVRSPGAYIEWLYSTTSDSGSAISKWTVEIVVRSADLSQMFQRRGQRVSAQGENCRHA